MILELTRTLAWAGLISCAIPHATLAAKVLPQTAQDGNAGFVVTSFRYALSTGAGETNACPDGLTPLDPRAHERRRVISAEDSACANPEAFGPDPNFRTVKVRDAKAIGIDLDGRDSRLQNTSSGACPHDDLMGMNSERGIDNQFYRLVGCLHGYHA